MSDSVRSSGPTLTDLVDDLGREAGSLPAFQVAGPLYELIGSEAHTAPTVATLLWQAAVRTRTFWRALAQAGYPASQRPPEFLVVPHSDWDVFSLVVFAEIRGEPRSLWMTLDQTEVAEALASRLRRLAGSGLEQIVPIDAIASLAGLGPLHVTIVQAPEMEPSAAFAPALPVVLAGTATASVGILARRPNGNQVGVTTARHLFANAGLGPTVGLTTATVSGHAATVDAEDAMSDAAFLLADDPANDFAALLPPPAYNGVLAGMTPRQNEVMTFAGCTSGNGTTVVRGWSPELPWVAHDMQMRVVTDLVTAPGDSGAALLDSCGKVCGLAFQASKWNVKPAISSWIWADSALQGLGLIPFP
jgi:hypothetical protein